MIRPYSGDLHNTKFLVARQHWELKRDKERDHGMPDDDAPAAPRGSILLNILSCPDCGATMTLTHIVPGDPDYQRLIFRCETCHRSETIIVKRSSKIRRQIMADKI